MGFDEPNWRPCPISRFPGGKYLDELLYAIINWLEATVGLFTLGKWYPQWTFRYDDGAIKQLRNKLLQWGVECTLCERWFPDKADWLTHLVKNAKWNSHSCKKDADVQPR